MYIGVDLAKKTITCTLLKNPTDLLFFGKTFDNNEKGFNGLLSLISQYLPIERCIFITENTGVYGEKLYYFLHRKHCRVTIEPAHYIRRAFRLKKKTDPVDSRMIGEYGYRYEDQLHFWKPPSPVVEQIRILLVNRALLQKEKTSHINIMKALDIKEIQGFEHFHQESILFLKNQKKLLDKSIKITLNKDRDIAHHTTNLCTIPGVGLIFTANFLIITEGFQYIDYRNLAGYLGICPQEYISGESVYQRPKSDKKGPNRMRKQLYLSAMAAIKHNTHYRLYFQRLEAKGKPSKLILNNIENKLLRTACAVVLSRRPYDPDYKSVRFF